VAAASIESAESAIRGGIADMKKELATE